MTSDLFYLLSGSCLILMICGVLYIRFLLAERKTLRELAYRDPITGLLNRNGYQQLWTQYRGKYRLAFLSLDLDGFKEINDTYGHAAGDQLLQEISLSLQQITNNNQQAFRMGGDEFLIILKNCEPALVEVIAELLLNKIERPYFIQDRDISVTGSIGISIRHATRADWPVMMEEADRAMYFAKQLGKNCYCVYANSRQEQASYVDSTKAQKSI
ncbi:GGDEF domain-containing protein [Paenibacillus sp. M1]|uniref:GGDEF domain-containing protein n=1 Tax=Paenibacillus haidiansis TaxID=1574488 RepID=A0ABU7VNG7_9BACL